jgi:hypothetical protein
MPPASHSMKKSPKSVCLSFFILEPTSWRQPMLSSRLHLKLNATRKSYHEEIIRKCISLHFSSQFASKTNATRKFNGAMTSLKPLFANQASFLQPTLHGISSLWTTTTIGFSFFFFITLPPRSESKAYLPTVVLWIASAINCIDQRYCRKWHTADHNPKASQNRWWIWAS